MTYRPKLDKVSANDTTADTLDAKLVAGTGISLTVNNDGGNESITVASTATVPALNDLSDVNTTGTGTGDVIYNNGSGWVDYPLGVGSAITNDGSYLKLGSITGNGYTRVSSSNGNVQLFGEAIAYKDLLQSLIGQRLENPSSHIEQTNAEGVLTFKKTCDLNDYAIMNIQMQHDWSLETVIYPHLHWFQASATVPNWLLQYRWQTQGAAKTTAWTYLPYSAHAYTYSSGTINQITIFSSITPPSGAGLSDIVQFRLLRDVANTSSQFIGGADTLDASALAINFDIHYQVDSFGSDEEYIKDATNKIADADSEFITDSDGVILEDNGA